MSTDGFYVLLGIGETVWRGVIDTVKVLLTEIGVAGIPCEGGAWSKSFAKSSNRQVLRRRLPSRLKSLED